MAVAQLLFIDLPGKGRLTTKNSSWSPAGMTKSKVIADTGSAGTGKSPKVGKLKFDVANNGKVDPVELDSLDDVNITVQDDNGKTWLLRNCTTTNDVELKDGWMPVEMEFDGQEGVG